MSHLNSQQIPYQSYKFNTLPIRATKSLSMVNIAVTLSIPFFGNLYFLPFFLSNQILNLCTDALMSIFFPFYFIISWYNFLGDFTSSSKYSSESFSQSEKILVYYLLLLCSDWLLLIPFLERSYFMHAIVSSIQRLLF